MIFHKLALANFVVAKALRTNLAQAASPQCEALLEQLDPDRVFCNPEELGAEWWNFGNPACNSLATSVSVVVRPQTTQDVASTILIARDTNTSLSVRSGGHSYTCNAVKAGSIHLDMRSLNSVDIINNTIDTNVYPGEEKLLRFGTGNTFKDLFAVADMDAYSFVHGECWSVGVGGFYLHGGNNGGMSRYGMGNESLRSMEVVTAFGEILRFEEPRTRITKDSDWRPIYDRQPVLVYDANGDAVGSHEDLWDALRVAGSSFGVVTEMTVQLWTEPEPYVWFISIRLTQREQFALLRDAAADPDVQVNLYDFNGLRGVVQISMRHGSSDPVFNREECMQWLDGWFWRKRIWFWRFWRYQPIVTGFPYLVGVQGRADYGHLYPDSEWVTASTMTHLGSPHSDSIMEYFREQSDSGPAAFCWLVFVPVTAFGDVRLYVDYTCWPAEEHRERMRGITRHIVNMWPEETTRYYNVPIDMGNEAENDALTELYFPNNLEQLRTTKGVYDPENIISAFQGITPN